MNRIFYRTLLCASAYCLGAAATYALDQTETVQETAEKILKGQATPAQPLGVSGRSQQGTTLRTDSASESCPEPTALELFKHQIEFEGAEESSPLKGLGEIHTDVWERGTSTAFYVREPLPDYASEVHMVYLFDKDGIGDGGGCPAGPSWTECVERLVGVSTLGAMVRTCNTTIAIRTLPAWEPSPNSPVKLLLADHLRSEIEAKWEGVQEIVIRDFNLSDPQITMYLKMPDGEYFQGCALQALREPHCDHWHSFGQAPLASLREWVFKKPYRLK